MTARAMALFILFVFIGTLCGIVTCQTPVSTCQDTDTQACLLFQKARPDICSDVTVAQHTCKRFCGQCPLECYSCPTPVMNPYDCNSTVTCESDMTCMGKRLRASDGHTEYIMNCEKKTICDGQSLGFVVGKRDQSGDENDDDVNVRNRQERDVTISCCDTDFCNLALEATTVATTPGLGQCARDITFMIDDSGSVGTANFNIAKSFVRKVLSFLQIGPLNNQVAMVTFSTRPIEQNNTRTNSKVGGQCTELRSSILTYLSYKINWYLNTHTTKYDTLSAVDNVAYVSGTTRTGDALYTVRTNILTTNRGDRPNVDNVVIILTDGQSTEKAHTLQQAKLLHGISNNVISIGIGSGVDHNELNAIATDQNHMLDVHGYSDLSVLVTKVLQLICG